MIGSFFSEIFFVVLFLTTINSSSCWAYSPNVSHRHIAGLWKLTPSLSITNSNTSRRPLKEFTVYPKDKERQRRKQQEDAEAMQKQSILLMLKENGQFEQYTTDNDIDDEEDDDDDAEEDNTGGTVSRTSSSIPQKMRYHKDAVLDRYSAFGRLKGNWKLVDGKLILAPDRPTSTDEDALLEGEVVAFSETSLLDNPALHSKQSSSSVDDGSASTAASARTSSIHVDSNVPQHKKTLLDTHLSVPKGRINVGRFMYPKHHPYFFDTPMYNPIPKGKFELKQVLGSLNTQQQEQEEKAVIEKFSPKDFYGKKFWLTSHPLKEQTSKGTKRWSIKYNKYVEDVPSSSSKKAAEDKPIPTVSVLEVEFFQNNTFATIGGMGSSTILRGKFYVIGDHKDQLWMQIWRFGFGRSVSGSVFSEGIHLTKDDEKTYWGRIELVPADYDKSNESDKVEHNHDIMTQPQADTSSKQSATLMNPDNPPSKVTVQGSVIFGGNGLEPQPIGRFILREQTSSQSQSNIHEDEDEIEDDDLDTKDDDEPFSFHNNDAFQ